MKRKAAKSQQRRAKAQDTDATVSILPMETQIAFHSFRHAFVDACREVISEEGRHAFTGHSEGGVGRSYGTDVGKRRLCRVCLYVI